MKLSRYRLELAALFLVLVGCAALAAQRDWLEPLDQLLYDAVIQRVPLSLDERIVIVGIDEQTLSAYGTWPWPRDLQARLLDRVAAGAPDALFVDIVYSRVTDPAADRALARSLDAATSSVLPIIVDVLAIGQPPVEILPYPELLAEADLLGHVHLELDNDSISRGTYLYEGVGAPVWRHAMLELARALAGSPERIAADFADCEQRPPAAGFTVERCGYVRIPFAGPPGSVPQISALDLLSGDLAAGVLAGKIVLLGLTTAGIADWVTSPVSGEGRPISGVEYNANLLNALLKDQLIAPAPRWLQILLCITIASLAALLLPRLAPKGMLGLTLLLIGLPLFASALLLVVGIVLPLSAGALAALIAYPFWSWRRHEIAWRYVDQEMLRLGAVEPQLPMPTIEDESAHWIRQLNQLARLLQLECSEGRGAPAPQAAGWTSATGRRVLDVRLPDGRALQLAPGPMVQPEPAGFTPLEQQLLRGALAGLGAEERRPASLPGEGLALRIRLLKREAERVRLARDTGQKALEQMRNGVLVLSALGEVEFVNTAFHELLGSRAPMADPFAYLEQQLVLPLGQNWQELWRQVLLTGEPVGFEVRLAGDRLGYLYGARLDSDATSERGSPALPDWAIIVTDITEVRTAQSLREEALAFVSHDLRSPITSILALIRRQPDAPLASEIERYAQRSLAVSEQFLQLSRLESQPVVETYELDLLDTLGNALDQLYVLATEARVPVDRSAIDAVDEPVWVQGNGELLERAFVNLLSNAIKYSAPAPGAEAAPVEVGLALSAATVRVRIDDCGPGIPAADLPRLFEPYYRSSDPQLAPKRGAGLGLRFAKTVAERHGGSISVQSEPGQGSSFTFALPRLPIGDDLQ
ncbi:MAG: CHASE2 domain-containing protein [Pseudomonadota bacterium]